MPRWSQMVTIPAKHWKKTTGDSPFRKISESGPLQQGGHLLLTAAFLRLPWDQTWWDQPVEGVLVFENGTVDGRNPAPVDMKNIPLFIGFHTSHVVQDFSHQQYCSFFLEGWTNGWVFFISSQWLSVWFIWNQINGSKCKMQKTILNSSQNHPSMSMRVVFEIPVEKNIKQQARKTWCKKWQKQNKTPKFLTLHSPSTQKKT